MKFLKYYSVKTGFIILTLLFFHLLDPFQLAVQFGYLLVFCIIVLKQKTFFKLLDNEALWLFLFSLSYTLFNALGPNKGAQFLIIQLIFPVAFYTLGKYLIIKEMTKTHIVMLLIFLGISFSLTSLLSVGASLLKEGFVATERNVPNFWTGKEILATGLSAFLSYNLLLPGILLTNKKVLNKYMLITLSGIYLISLLCVFRLGSRMSIAITAIGFLVGFLHVLVSQKLVANIKFILVSLIIVIAVIKFAPLDLNANYLSVLGDRLQDKNASSISTAGNRTGLWEDAASKLFKYPLGWQSKHYAHNVWLDIARVSGLIPLLFFLINNIIVIHNLRSIFSLKKLNIGITTTFILFFISIFLIFFAEPILDGTFFAVTLYCLFQGILKEYATNFKLDTKMLR